MSHLEDIAIRFQVQLEGLKSENARKYNEIMFMLSSLLESAVGAREISELSRRQVESLIAEVIQEFTPISNAAATDLIKELKNIAKYSFEFEAGALVAGTSVESISAKIARSKIWKEVLAQPLTSTGGLLDPFIKSMTTNQIVATGGVIRRAHAEGWSTRQMLQVFRGTKANRYTDGIVPRIGRGNETVIRTAIQHVNSVGRQEVWKANPDVVKGYRWVSTLDSRTSATCRGLDGKEFKVDQGPLPPIHLNCRSTTVAVVDEIFRAFADRATRSSEKGSVPQTQTYYQWLKNQSAEYQDSVIGDARGKLLRNGGMNAEEFTRLQLSRTFRPLTLEQMRRLKPLAFKKAGI